MCNAVIIIVKIFCYICYKSTKKINKLKHIFKENICVISLFYK